MVYFHVATLSEEQGHSKSL